MPKVSVIIPVYGHAEYVLDSLDSVFAQSYTDFEVIVINDGSPDATESILEPYISSGKIKYVCQENKGVSTARNHGLALASGDYVAFLDDDDMWPASKLEVQANQMENCDAVVVGGSSHGFIDIDTHNADRASFDPHKFELLNTINFFLGNPFTSPGQVIIRKSALDVVGGFDEAIWGVDDLDLWIRLSRIGEIRQYEYMALYYRVHDANASLDLEKMARNTELVIRKNLLLSAEEDKAKFERAGYRFLFRCAGKKLLWKGAKFIKMGRKDEGWQMIQQSISMFRPRFKSDAVLVVQFFLATLKIPFRMGSVR
jgi:glycosyltransferase involved in cell wall biosynthesis